MDIGKAFTFIFEDKEWLSKVLIGIAVEVEKRGSAAHGFGQQFLAAGPVHMPEVDARLARDIRERHVGRQDLLDHVYRSRGRGLDQGFILPQRSAGQPYGQHDSSQYRHGDQGSPEGMADDFVGRCGGLVVLHASFSARALAILPDERSCREIGHSP